VLYSIDTSALIHAWKFPYKPAIFPCFWEEMEKLIQVGKLAAVDEVKEEILAVDDDLCRWIKQRDGLFVPRERALQEKLNIIQARFPKIIDPNDPKPQADVFVIALAMLNDCKVVSQEKGGSEENPKIPFVCRHYDIECIDLYDFVAEQDWCFNLPSP